MISKRPSTGAVQGLDMCNFRYKDGRMERTRQAGVGHADAAWRGTELDLPPFAAA